MYVIIEAIVWGLLWEFPITCLLALSLAALGASFWGVWGAMIGGATGLVLGTMLDVAVWRITAWVPSDPRKHTAIWTGALGMLAILSLVLAIVYWSP
jgi:hypothetical protein